MTSLKQIRVKNSIVRYLDWIKFIAMKKTLILMTGIIILIACGNNETAEKKVDNPQSQQAEDPTIQKGLELVASNDCFGCHKVAEQLTGPAYQDVAERYKDSTGAVVDTLAGRIIRGSVGHWGPAQMTPHANLSEEDAKAMVHYVLSLKK